MEDKDSAAEKLEEKLDQFITNDFAHLSANVDILIGRSEALKDNMQSVDRKLDTILERLADK